jgi:prepilin-type processing-associated H-X9-DG protein/prepilin-type N-terminal cleavage/methylation domain-containing protein
VVPCQRRPVVRSQRVGPREPWSCPARRESRFAAGFNLIELLVVLAVIAVLASLLMPSLRAAQSKATRIHCTSNLRQLGVALEIYASDNGFYPVAMTTNGLGNWQHALWPSATDQVLYCPQIVPASDQFLEYFPTNQLIFPHYGYNASGAQRVNPPPQNPGLGGNFAWTGLGVGGFVAAAENWVQVPSQMIALGDGMTFLPPPLVSSETLSPADPLYNIYPFILQPQGYPGANKNHNGGANMLFCDGHVEYAKQSWWLASTDTSKRLWNHDNQSHPEFQ